MPSNPQSPRIHLPKGWQDCVQSGVLHAIALAHYVIVYARACAADSIEEWLSSAQWTQLKNAVRAARRRQADLSRDPTKHVTLPHRAWLMLHELAERDEVTLSELIEKKLEKAWMRL